jgi:hypothetical protein
VNQDPIFTNNKLPAGEVGYPGGIFDPLGYSKGNMASLKLKEIKNGRLAMLAFVGFCAQVRASPRGSTTARQRAPLPHALVARGRCTLRAVVTQPGITHPSPRRLPRPARRRCRTWRPTWRTPGARPC